MRLLRGFQCHDDANAVFTQLRAGSNGKPSFATDARDLEGWVLSWTSGVGSRIDACRDSGVGCWFIKDDEPNVHDSGMYLRIAI